MNSRTASGRIHRVRDEADPAPEPEWSAGLLTVGGKLREHRRVATATHCGSATYGHLITPAERRARLAGITGRITAAGLLSNGSGRVDYEWRDGDRMITVTEVDPDEVVPVIRRSLYQPVLLRPGLWSSRGRQRSVT